MVKTVVFKVATLLAAGLCAAGAAQAQDTKISLGMSGWTGFAPLTLADKAGIFKKNGLDVELKMIPQKDRHLALASEAIQCVATTVETHVAWNANGVPIVQIFQMDKSYGADGLAVRNDIKSFADLKGKSIGVSAPGTAPYFGLAWMLSKNGMTLKDVKLVSSPAKNFWLAALSCQRRYADDLANCSPLCLTAAPMISLAFSGSFLIISSASKYELVSACAALPLAASHLGAQPTVSITIG